MGAAGVARKGQHKGSVVMKLFSVLTVVMVTQIYNAIKLHCTQYKYTYACK